MAALAFATTANAQIDEPVGGAIVCVIINDDGKVIKSKIAKAWGDAEIAKDALMSFRAGTYGKRLHDPNRNRWVALGVGTSGPVSSAPSACRRFKR